MLFFSPRFFKLVEYQLPIVELGPHMVTQRETASQQLLAERVFHHTLDRPAQRTRAKPGVKTLSKLFKKITRPRSSISASDSGR